MFLTIGAVLAIHTKSEHSHTKPNTMWEDSLVGVPGKDFPHCYGEEVGGRSASKRAVACSSSEFVRSVELRKRKLEN